jgi:general secretion pathway protein D
MNSLIVSGPVDYMGLMEQIINRLDASSPQQAKIKVFPLKNADAAQMARLLMQLFRMTQTAALANASQRSIQYTLVRNSGNGEGEKDAASATVGTAEQNALTITVDPRTNSLLVGGTDHYVSLVSQIIDSLDASEANERRTEVVRLKNSQAQDVATAIRNFLDQERLRTTQGLAPDEIGTAQRLLEREVAVVAEQLSNTLLVSANPRYFDQIKELIEELDRAQPQVLIQVLLAEVTLDRGLDLGMSWTYDDVPFAAGITVDESKWIDGGFASAVTGGKYSFLLQALEEDGRLEVLSRPQIVTSDNKAATISIGQRVPLITDTRVTDLTGTSISNYRYEDVGVNLSVTPKISPDGTVKMEIGTTNSAVSSSSVPIGKDITAPIINQRRANTTVTVPSGQTILIGGLIATTDDKRMKKVPWLGDIPVIGAMFRKSQNTRERKELLILLTPQILSNSVEAGRVKDLEKVTREQLDRSGIKDEIKRDDLQKQLLDPLFPDIELEKTPSKSKGDKSL